MLQLNYVRRGKNLRQTASKPHPCSVRDSGLLHPKQRAGLATPSFDLPLLFRFAFFSLISTIAVFSQEGSPASSQAAEAFDHVAAEPPGLLYQGVPAPIGQDEGASGLRLQLRRLGTTGRLMQIVAHPDDEDGGMLTLQARGHGVSTLLMTLNRGEGGQNKIGSNLSDVLGVLRAEELLASDEYYGIQERFSRVADFGFSKTAAETFEKWGGHDTALADIVRVIRTFRPDVLVARFSGTERDGHGNHQASSILAKEAFRAAADPKRFPEQIAQGLQPWQAKKFYVGNVCPWGSTTCADEKWTVKFNTGQNDPLLGTSYIQFAMQGLRHQMSQGAANWTVEPGDRFTFYKLEDSAIPSAAGKDGHEKDFFDGIDTTLPGVAKISNAESRIKQLSAKLSEAAKQVAGAASDAAGNDTSTSRQPLLRLVQALRETRIEVESSPLNAEAKLNLLTRIASKQQQAETALNLALGVTLSGLASITGEQDLPKGSDVQASVSPGQEFTVALTFHNGSKQPVRVDHIALEVPPGWSTINTRKNSETVAPGRDLHADFHLRVPKNTPYTRPYWHRDNPETESVNHIDDEKYATLPFPPPALRARVEYSAGSGTLHGKSEISTAVLGRFVEDNGKEEFHPLAVLPTFSVMLDPGTQVISTHNGGKTTVTVAVTSNQTRAARGVLRLELPTGWKADPAQLAVTSKVRGEKQEFQFAVTPANLQQGRATLRAVLESEGEKYSEGYTLVTREDLGSFYYYQPARQKVSIVDVQVPHDLKVGYIMGAGDDIATVLKQIGMDVTLIPAEKLGTADLSQYGTIVLGIRAYDTQKEVAANNKKLLDFVSAGGTLVVQYDTAVGDFNSGKFTPYSAELSRARVSVEEAPVTILAPDDSIFHYPNTITQHDFDGWVQERGLYFMDKWDSHFTPLLACHDPGEEEQKGGLLRAQYGKGTYIYAAYAFFRQLPAGVPGAVRLYVNILSAGHQKQQAANSTSNE
jgi:LmbE family N-acetylglucosaminyl deacetylase